MHNWTFFNFFNLNTFPKTEIPVRIIWSDGEEVIYEKWDRSIWDFDKMMTKETPRMVCWNTVD